MPADQAAHERELHERVGYVRCQLDEAREKLQQLEASLADHVRRREEVSRQIDVVRAEIAVRRRELTDRLGEWCALDDIDQRTSATDAFKKIDAVRSSLTYRVTVVALAAINKVRSLVTLQWLRGRP
jgi:chromosome segregation ATPase